MLIACPTLARASALLILCAATACGATAPARAPVAKKKTKAADAGVKIPELTSGTWQSMGYDSTNTYTNPNETMLSVDNAKDVKELWRFKVSGFPAGTAAIGLGRVFVTATGGTYALNLETGEALWAREDLQTTSSPAYVDGAIFLHVTGANLYKLDAKTGKTLWGPIKVHEHGEADSFSSPIVAGDTVIVGRSTTAEVTNMSPTTARGGASGFSVSDGSMLWTYYTVPESGENGAAVWSSVAIDASAKVVFAATGNNYTMGGEHSDAIHAFDLGTGDGLWSTQVRKDDVWATVNGFPGVSPNGPDFDFGANPILAEVDGRKLVADGDKGGAFWALDRETGETVWSRTELSDGPISVNGGILNNGAFDGTYFYVVANQPKTKSALLYALDPNDGSNAWEPAKIDDIVWGAPTIANGLLVVPAGAALNLYDASSGELLNSFETGGSIAGAAAIVDGKIVVKSGLQYPLDPSTTNNDQVICYGL